MDNYTEELQKQVRLLVPAKGYTWLSETFGSHGVGKVSQVTREMAMEILGKGSAAAAKRVAKTKLIRHRHEDGHAS